MTEQTCDTCRFCVGYRAQSYEPSNNDDLHCRRFPPQFSGGQWGGIFGLPTVSRIDWCGEWAAKEQAAEDEA